MSILNFKGFSINIAKTLKKKTTTPKPHNISKLCKAVVMKNDEGVYVAKVNMHNDTESPDYLIIPFTEESHNLKGKEFIFSLERDKHHHYVCIIRTKQHATFFPGNDNTYSSFKPDMVVGGHIVKIDGKNYFNYEQFVSFNVDYSDYNPIKVDEENPLFK